ncbi:lysylphosphatidylglycerol synthase domain-containing protein [Desulfosporosinus hippei]|uniref:Phosphatidylglycerol lysyltransferase n=1 Tax=Desulfosporosinus hippei DSM 8344 TaxID=1121419 RepID=A0A1G8HHW4_9FIRM|nr:lysylphosphatidylglycerol synthase domain-containing protein [Desulfosporosinus hippei]SDI06297.1 hypothetical protein SAMN05443529_12554 [Desulfosporosinus hippei DSM 8344]
MTINEKTKTLLKWAKVIFVGLVIWFLTKYFTKNYDELMSLDFQIRWSAFFLSMLFFFIYKITLASLWHYITVLNNTQISYVKAITAYLYSILGKYIPGKVFMLGARLVYYDSEGAKMRKVTICFLIENILTLLGATLLFIFSLFFFPNDILSQYQYTTWLLIILFFICIHPKILNFFLGLIEKVTKKTDLEISMTYVQMVKLVMLFVANWLVVGLGFYLLVCSIYPLPISVALYASGIFALAAIIGILSLFSPSGLGVREGIIVLGLSVIMPPEYAIIVSIVSRLWSTIPELALIGMAFIYSQLANHIDKKTKRETET